MDAEVIVKLAAEKVGTKAELDMYFSGKDFPYGRGGKKNQLREVFLRDDGLIEVVCEHSRDVIDPATVIAFGWSEPTEEQRGQYL
jgi:hypothetical protein